MAFNFLGTIGSIEEFEEFEEFIQIESAYINKRISHLSIEFQRYQELLDKFLISDLTMRSPYLKADLPDKDWLKSAKQNPLKIINIPDALNGLDVDSLKKMFLDSIKAKREKNEFKVKKIRDLMDQINDEIIFLTDEKEKYLETLDRIRARFDLDGFIEIQEVKKEDEIGTKNITSDFGIIENSSSKQYMVTSISELDNSIVFERSAPSIKKGETFTLTNGKNNGVKTVVGYKSSHTIVVAEALTQEAPSQSMAIFNK